VLPADSSYLLLAASNPKNLALLGITILPSALSYVS
jgi:hypothetical protein